MFMAYQLEKEALTAFSPNIAALMISASKRCTLMQRKCIALTPSDFSWWAITITAYMTMLLVCRAASLFFTLPCYVVIQTNSLWALSIYKTPSEPWGQQVLSFLNCPAIYVGNFNSCCTDWIKPGRSPKNLVLISDSKHLAWLEACIISLLISARLLLLKGNFSYRTLEKQVWKVHPDVI